MVLLSSLELKTNIEIILKNKVSHHLNQLQQSQIEALI